ncbi:MAG: carboxypeptidase regulatory-like domain-containing protein, partial [Acidobacteria bacterium]
MILAASLAVFGQGAGTGFIQGSVSDPTGAVIVGAKVTLVDKSTNTSTSTESNGSGVYTFTNVKPGTYDLTSSKSGFRDWRFAGAHVLVGGQLTLNIEMKLGAAVQEVTVTSTPGAELQTSNSTMGTVVGGDTLQALPNANRDATTLLIYQPNTAPTFGGAEGNTTGGQVAGAMSDQNTYTVDGGDATDDLAGDNGYTSGNRHYVAPQAAIPTPIESIQEFRVNTNNMTADFSGSDGAQVLLVTKRGTDQWHGSMYDYFSADWLNAAGWNLNVVNGTKVKYHQNRFGASVGGPMLPGQALGGKTYFYFNYEGFRWPNQNGRFERLVPSDTLRQGIIQYRDDNGNIYQQQVEGLTGCGAGSAGTVGPSPCDPRPDFRTVGLALNPIINQLWSTYEPEPNDCANAGDHLNTCGYFGVLKLNIRDDFAVGRIDHDFGSNWRFNGTYRYYKLVYPS